jgi:hypothetical protein
MQQDQRGFRIAVVGDELANSATSGFDVLEVLQRAGWGAIVLPPAWYPDEVLADLLVQFAEQVEEFLRHGYDVVCLGSCEALAGPLAQLGVAMPASLARVDKRELSSFLCRTGGAATGA